MTAEWAAITQTGVVCVTLLAALVYALDWLKGYAEMENELKVSRHMTDKYKEALDLNYKRLEDKLIEQMATIDELRSELNAVNLKMGLKLK